MQKQSRFPLLSLLSAGVLALSAVSTLAQNAHKPAFDFASPQTRLPLMQSAPKIDGVIEESEWQGASRSAGFTRYAAGVLTAQRGAFWIGGDTKNLYLAVKTETPPEGKILQRANMLKDGANIGAVFADDSIEVWLAPQPEQSPAQRKVFFSVFNARDAFGGNATTMRSKENWQPQWRVKSSVQDGFWNCEMALPWSELGIESPQNKTIALRLARNWRQAVGAEQSESSLGNKAFSDVSNMPRITFDESAPVVSVTQLQNAPNEPINIGLQFFDPTGSAQNLAVKARIKPSGSAETTSNKTIELAPGAKQTLNISGVGGPNEIFDTHLEVSNIAGDEIYYRRDFSWQLNRPAEIWNLNPEAHKRVDVRFAYFPSFNAMHVRADLSNLPGKENAREIKLAIRRKNNAQIIAAVTMPPLKNNVSEIWKWDIPELADGEYELVSQIEGVKVEPIVDTFERHHFEWENNKLGTSDIVVPPFTPIKARGNTVDVILRSHQLNGAGLWDQVVADGQPLLKAPMRLEAKIGGRVLPASGKLSIVSQKPTQAVTNAQWQAGALRGSTQSVWDYDGAVRSTLTLQPPSAPVESLTLIIPLDEKIVPLMHAVTMGTNSRSGRVPAGNGTVWDSSQSSNNQFIGPFVPYIWLGEQGRGLAVFADNDAGWITDDKTPSQKIVRNANGVLELHLQLVQKTARWETPRQITLGFQATPTKPMPDNWRQWTVSAARTSLAASQVKVPGQMQQAFVGSPGYWGGIGSSGAIYPADGDFSLWDEFTRLRQTGKADPAYLDQWVAKLTRLSEQQRERARVHVSANLRSMVTQPENVLIYTNARGMRPDSPQGQTFINEWNRQQFPQRQWEYASDLSYDVDPVASYRDSRTWYYQKALATFADAIYWDCVYLQPNYNTITSAAYVREDGQVQPSAGIWSMREIVRRGAVLAHEMGKINRNMVHMSATEIAPINGFAATQADWELKYGEGDFQDKFPRDYIQAQSIGRQVGLVPIAILTPIFIVGTPAEASWQYRTASGVMLTHEIKPWSSRGAWTKPDPFWETYDRLLEFGYGQPNVQVHNYWEKSYPAKISGESSSLLVSKPGSAMLVLCDYGEGGDFTVELDAKALGLGGKWKATRLESGADIAVQNNAFTLNLKKHDFEVIRIETTP
jgi:hypothetical protein